MKYQDIFVFGQNLKELRPNNAHVINLKNETNRPAKNISATLAHFAHFEYCFSVCVIVKMVECRTRICIGIHLLLANLVFSRSVLLVKKRRCCLTVQRKKSFV